MGESQNTKRQMLVSGTSIFCCHSWMAPSRWFQIGVYFLLIVVLTPSSSIANIPTKTNLNNLFVYSVQICRASLKISGDCWSCFSRKLILVRPMHQRPSRIVVFPTFTHDNPPPDTHSLLLWMGSKPFFSSLNICQCLRRNFIETCYIWNGEWKIVALGSLLPQPHQFCSSFHLYALLDTLLIFEISILWSNAFRNGCCWVLKPTFPRISPGKRRKSAMVSSFSLLGHTCKNEIPSKWPIRTFPVIHFKVSS
jgi:hypothetical protein